VGNVDDVDVLASVLVCWVFSVFEVSWSSVGGLL
jgi:hypothetical protein